MTRSDYFRPVRGGISGLCEEADDKSIWKPQKLTQLYTRYIFYVLLSFATVLAIKGLAAAS